MFAKRICTGPSLIRLGCAAMIAGVAWHRFVHPGPHLSEDLVDGVWGLCYGVSIAAWLRGLRAGGSGGGRCGSVQRAT